MSVITDTWRHLVRRRLWPLALLLVGALAAVPVLLAEDPEPVAAPAPSPQAKGVDADGAAVGEPIVAMAGTEDRSRRRRVLGARKNPFQPVPVPTPEVSTPPNVTAPSGGGGSTVEHPPTGGSTAPSGGFGSPSTPGAPSPPVYTPPAPVEPEPPKEKHALYELTVRFDGERRSLERLEALPDADNPVLVYLGPGEGGRSAVFMVDAAVTTEGDATCRPDPSICETIELREGETQFLNGDGIEHQLDLVKIHRSKTTDAKKAAKARAAESKAGRRVLKARVARHGPLRYDYDRESGTVRRLGRKAFQAKVATVTGQVAAGL